MKTDGNAVARRFRAFRNAVQAIVREESEAWYPAFKKRYRETMAALVENYLAGVSPLRNIMKPKTFVAGARPIVASYLQGFGLEFALAGEFAKSTATSDDLQVAAMIAHTICPGDHDWSGTFCTRCFSPNGDPEKSRRDMTWRCMVFSRSST